MSDDKKKLNTEEKVKKAKELMKQVQELELSDDELNLVYGGSTYNSGDPDGGTDFPPS